MALLEKAGRPLKEIDWKRVDELLEAGCSGQEIAPHFDIHPDTLYDRVQAKFGITFSEYSSKFAKKGESSLREVQYKKALKGDNMMLVWLGKNRLKQRDTPQEIEVSSETITQFKDIMNQISSVQSPKAKISEMSNKAEEKS